MCSKIITKVVEDMDIIARIEQLRKQRDWSVYKLAIEAGLTQSTLTNMYTRGTYPSISTLINICDAFGITLAQFFATGERETVLTDEENEILNDYRNLSPKNKVAIKTLLNNLK